MTHLDICATCAAFSVRQAEPEYASIGMGLCLALTTRHLSAHVAWDATCEAFKPAADVEARLQYVQVQRLNQIGAEDDSVHGTGAADAAINSVAWPD